MIKKERQHSSPKSKQLFYQFEPSLDDDNGIKKKNVWIFVVHYLVKYNIILKQNYNKALKSILMNFFSILKQYYYMNNHTITDDHTGK